MREWYCHDHKTWTDNWKRERGMLRWAVLQAVPSTSGRVYFWRTPKEAYNPECLVPTVKHGGGFCDGLATNIMVQYFVGPIITLRGRITAREYVDRLGNQVHRMFQTSTKTLPCSGRRLWRKRFVTHSQEDVVSLDADRWQQSLDGHGMCACYTRTNKLDGI
jgi:hypothetical protein